MISGAPADRLRNYFALPFILLFTERRDSPGGGSGDQSNDPRRSLVQILQESWPRDCILRGRYDDASRCLMDVLRHISHNQQRLALERTLDAEATQWIEDMRTAYAALSRAEKSNNPTDNAYLNAKARVMELEKNAEKIMLLIERSMAEPMSAEATFQMALCKHEQAERLSRTAGDAPAERETSLNAWKNAESWWGNYLTKYGPTAPAGQNAHGQEMKNRPTRK